MQMIRIIRFHSLIIKQANSSKWSWSSAISRPQLSRSHQRRMGAQGAGGEQNGSHAAITPVVGRALDRAQFPA